MPMRERNLQNAQGGWLHFIMNVLPWRKRSQRKLWMIPPEAENSLWRNLNKKEIADASLQPGEDEELEQAYRKMSNSRKIAESLAESYQLSGNDAEDGAGNSLSRALRALRSVTMYDPALEQMEEQLAEVESLLSDYNHDVSEYMSDRWNLMKRIFAVQRIV